MAAARPGTGAMLGGAMVLALSSVAATLGLVVIFFVVFPVLVQGLIAFAAAQSLGERAENQEHARHHRMPGS